MRWKALAEIYTMQSFAPFSKLKFLFKNRRKNCQKFTKFAKFYENFSRIWPTFIEILPITDQCNRIPGARRLYGNSCSAALICEFCATRRIRFFVSDLFQKRPSWRGAAVAGPFCLQKRKKKEGKKEEGTRF